LDAADISPDGSVLAIGARTAIRIVDPMTGKERQNVDVARIGSHGLPFRPMESDCSSQAERSRSRRNSMTAAPGPRLRRITRLRLGSRNEKAALDRDSGRKLAGDGLQPGRQARGNCQQHSPAAELGTSLGRGLGEGSRPDAIAGTGHLCGFDQAGKRLAVSFDDTTAMVFDLETALKPATTK